MSSWMPRIPAMRSRTIVRAILYVNFFLFGLFVIPTTHHWIENLPRPLMLTTQLPRSKLCSHEFIVTL